MKELMDYCSKHGYHLILSFFKNYISITIYDVANYYKVVYCMEGKEQAYYKLIRALKTKINLDAICGSIKNK